MAVLSALESSPTTFIVLLVLGFVIGTAGHVYKNQVAVAIGIALVFTGTLILPAIVFLLR